VDSAGSQTFTFSDDASVLGAGSLGALSVSLSGTAYDPATAVLVGGSTSGANWFVNLGEFSQGSGTSSPVPFGISNLLQSQEFTADLAMTSFSLSGDTGTIVSTLAGNVVGRLAPRRRHQRIHGLDVAGDGGSFPTSTICRLPA